MRTLDANQLAVEILRLIEVRIVRHKNYGASEEDQETAFQVMQVQNALEPLLSLPELEALLRGAQKDE